MNIIYLAAGALVGYIASRIMRTNSQQGLLLDMVGVAGGRCVPGWLLYQPAVGRRDD